VSDAPNGRPFNLLPWLFGILGALIIAGVLASFSTASAVGRIDENLGLFRAETRREFDRQEANITLIEDKLDAHIFRTDTRLRDTNGGG